MPAVEKFFINTQMSRLSCGMGMEMGVNWELLDAKKWECDLSLRREWERDGNGNKAAETGGMR